MHCPVEEKWTEALIIKFRKSSQLLHSSPTKQEAQIAVKDLKSSSCSYPSPDIVIKIVLRETGESYLVAFFSSASSVAKRALTKAED